MHTRMLGKHEVGAIGLGLMTFDQTGTQPREQLAATVRAAVDAGVTLFDTADAYGPGDELGAGRQGANESLITGLLDELGLRDRVLLATKAGHVRPRGGGVGARQQPRHLSGPSTSLQRLGVDQIALWQHHRPDPKLDYAEVVDTLKAIHDSGKVAMVGSPTPTPTRSAWRTPSSALLSSAYRTSSRPPFRSSRPEIDVCEELGLAFLPWVPWAGCPRPRSWATSTPRSPSRRPARRQPPARRPRVGARPVAVRHPDPRRQAPRVDHRLRRRRRPRAHRRRSRPAERELVEVDDHGGVVGGALSGPLVAVDEGAGDACGQGRRAEDEVDAHAAVALEALPVVVPVAVGIVWVSRRTTSTG